MPSISWTRSIVLTKRRSSSPSPTSCSSTRPIWFPPTSLQRSKRASGRSIEDVTQNFGIDILRMKGIIAMKGDDERFVIQGVHMLIEGNRQRPWKTGEKRESRLVFIGRDLPKDELTRGFEACRAD